MGQTKAMRFCIFNTCQLDRLTGGGGYSQEFLVEEYHRIPQILTLFQTKKCHFHTRFLPGLKNSYPFSDLPEQKLCHHQLDQNASKKILKIHFEFAYFSRFLFHLDLKQQIRSYTPVVPSKAIPDSRPKWAKSLPVFKP